MPVCPKCNREYSKKGFHVHLRYCTGPDYVSTTRGKKKKKPKATNDKTAPAAHITATSPQEVVNPEEGAESQSKILTEINIKSEFDKMVTKLSKKEEKKDSKADMKYECGECGIQFNHKAEGGVCPGCGCELE